MTVISLAGWAAGMYFGLIRQPSSDDIRHPLQARDRMVAMKNARAQWKQFDRDGDGFINVNDIREVAKLTNRDVPSDAQAHEYIAKGDISADGVLDYEEYLALFELEWRSKHPIIADQW